MKPAYMEAAEELHSKNVSRKITEKAKWWVIVAHQHFSSVKNIWKSYIWTADDQLPVGLLAQLVEHRNVQPPSPSLQCHKL